MIRVQRDDLGALDEIGSGGMAKVYLVGKAVPQVPGKLAFKELLPVEKLKGDAAAQRPQMLEAMRKVVELRDVMSATEQQELDSVAVWPLAMVEHQGENVGLLMPCLSKDFMLDTNDGPRVFEFQFLGADDRQAQANGYEKSRERAGKKLVRLALMARMAYAIAVIHRPRNGRRLVYGDISLRNAAVATDPPRILLMDCDGVADVTDPTRIQPHTPFFVPPEIQQKRQKLQDQATDVYKLALCVVRGLANGRGSTQLTKPDSSLIDPDLLDQAGVDLLKRALDPDRARRPSAGDISDYLIDRVEALADPPTLLSAELSTNVTLRGSEVFVRWAHKSAATIRIYSEAGDLDERGIKPDAYPAGYPIKPPTAGEIFVAAVNEDGEDVLSAGRLHYFEFPPVQISLNSPPVMLSDLPELRLPKSHAQLPAYPMHSTDAVALPPVRWPHVAPVPVMALASRAPLVRQLWKAFGQAFRANSDRVDAAGRPVMQQMIKQLRAEADKRASSTSP